MRSMERSRLVSKRLRALSALSLQLADRLLQFASLVAQRRHFASQLLDLGAAASAIRAAGETTSARCRPPTRMALGRRRCLATRPTARRR